MSGRAGGYGGCSRDSGSLSGYVAGQPWGSWRFEGGLFGRRGVELLRPPLISVASVKYFDGANALQTVDPAAYYFTDDAVPRLRFVNGYSFPATYDRDDVMRVEYVAGYPPGPPAEDYDATDPDAVPLHLAANVPQSVRSAILIQCRLLHEKLDPQEAAQQQAACEALLSSLRVYTLA